MPVLAFGSERTPVLLHVRTLLVELGVLKRLESEEILQRVAERTQRGQELVVDDCIGQDALVNDLLVLVVLVELLVAVVGDNDGVLLLGELQDGRVLLVLVLAGRSSRRVVQDAAFRHALELFGRVRRWRRRCGRGR